MKPKLKPTGTKRLKLNYDEVPSNFAFNFNLRRYDLDDTTSVSTSPHDGTKAGAVTRSLFSST
jgi:hypothetical protein